jgi:hypothetical protein
MADLFLCESKLDEGAIYLRNNVIRPPRQKEPPF